MHIQRLNWIYSFRSTNLYRTGFNEFNPYTPIQNGSMSYVKEEASLLATTVYDVANTVWSQKYMLLQKILGCRAPYAVRININGM
jgi:hypothetical protein